MRILSWYTAPFVCKNCVSWAAHRNIKCWWYSEFRSHSLVHRSHWNENQFACMINKRLQCWTEIQLPITPIRSLWIFEKCHTFCNLHWAFKRSGDKKKKKTEEGKKRHSDCMSLAPCWRYRSIEMISISSVVINVIII